MSSALEPLIGQVVVVDLDGPWIAFGRLERLADGWLELTAADLHDLGEGVSTREVYALETRQLGVRVNRTRVALPISRVIAVSRLEDCAP
jgi:hypothetical protein